MNIFGILTMIGGLALFLYGMDVMGKGLAKLSGGRLETILEKLTANKLKAVLLGTGVTAVIQSSSATTVMVVGFVNAGIMKLSQAIGVIMGANVGTTITAWILSMTGIEGDNFIVKLLKPSSFSPIMAVIGIILLLFAHKEKKKDLGFILIGFAILMFGMETMSGAVKPLADVPEFTNILLMFSNPFLGMLAGTALTAIVQSSSASIGILQALCATGAVGYSTALPIIMGQNIGTCITAILSSIGTSKNARRAALIHLYFNLISTGIFLVSFYSINYFMKFSFMNDTANPFGIAVIHTLLNVFAVVLLLPFSHRLEQLAIRSIREDTTKIDGLASHPEIIVLDQRFLNTPAFALEQCKSAAIDMAEVAKEAVLLAVEILVKYDKKKAARVVALEETADYYEDRLGTYLVQLGGRQLSERDSRNQAILLHSIGDFERISDHARNIMESAKEMQEKELKFSKSANEELMILTSAVKDVVNTAFLVFQEEDCKLAGIVEPMEEVVDYLKAELKRNHIKRLRKGKCTIQLGFIFSDITTNCERIADHCSKLASCLRQLEEGSVETHENTELIGNRDSKDFRKEVARLKKLYRLP
ncbi:MAG: Na/Pi cotransporter family protein [Lachnospiraceae bacterium]|nr:Na/Pi cotransporter family protein [Lachnospiraceae bacterium]